MRPGGVLHNPAKGRCLGLIYAWMKRAYDEEAVDQRSHHFDTQAILYDERCVARGELSRLPGYDTLTSYERPRRAGEGDEPLGTP